MERYRLYGFNLSSKNVHYLYLWLQHVIKCFSVMLSLISIVILVLTNPLL